MKTRPLVPDDRPGDIDPGDEEEWKEDDMDESEGYWSGGVRIGCTGAFMARV